MSTPSVSKPFRVLFQKAYLPIWIFVAVRCIPVIQSYLKESPIDFQSADMVPILKVQAQRFLNSQDVYAIIPEIWGGMKPIYLPFMWLPFTVSEFYGFDARWIVMLAMVVGIYFVFKIFTQSRILFISALGLIGIYYVLSFMINYDKETIIYSEEGIVVGYYLFLGYALSRKNAWLIGFGVAFCILTRYLLLFWLPVFWLYWFFFQSKKQAWIILGVSASVILGTFMIPYGFKNFAFFTGQHNGYIEMAQRTWSTNLTFTRRTLGLAKFFTVESIQLLHTLLITFTVTIPFLFAGLCWLSRSKKWLQHEMFPICCLKLCMVFFYNFLEMPFLYLFYTNTLFSYCVVFYCFSIIETSKKKASQLSISA